MKKEDKIKKLLEHYAQAIFIAIFKCRPHFLAAPYVRKLGNWGCTLVISFCFLPLPGARHSRSHEASAFQSYR